MWTLEHPQLFMSPEHRVALQRASSSYNYFPFTMTNVDLGILSWRSFHGDPCSQCSQVCWSCSPGTHGSSCNCTHRRQMDSREDMLAHRPEVGAAKPHGVLCMDLNKKFISCNMGSLSAGPDQEQHIQKGKICAGQGIIWTKIISFPFLIISFTAVRG